MNPFLLWRVEHGNGGLPEYIILFFMGFFPLWGVGFAVWEIWIAPRLTKGALVSEIAPRLSKKYAERPDTHPTKPSSEKVLLRYQIFSGLIVLHALIIVYVIIAAPFALLGFSPYSAISIQSYLASIYVTILWAIFCWFVE